MRVLIGLIVGTLAGLTAAILGYPLWEGRSSFVLSKSDKVQVATASAFYICSTQFAKDQPLIIKSANAVAQGITLRWVEEENFNIEQTDDLSYTAYARREDGGFYRLTLNRVTGELNFADHPSNSAKAFLADLCAQRTPWDQCESRISSITGGRKSECNFVVGEYSCPRLNNLGLIREAKFQCAPAERRFSSEGVSFRP
jgi:hypothetical protein